MLLRAVSEQIEAKTAFFLAFFGKIGPNGSKSDQIEKVGHIIFHDDIYYYKHLTFFFPYDN